MSRWIARTSPLMLGCLCSAALSIISCERSIDAEHRVRAGVLTLPELKRENISLEGDWEFYWNELYTAKDIPPGPAPKLFGVPGAWSELSYPGVGYATLRLRVPRGLPGGLLIHIPGHISSAYRMYCGEHLFKSAGRVSDSPETGSPAFLRRWIALPPQCAGATQIIWQISNFHTRDGGPHYAPYLSEVSVGRQRQTVDNALLYISLGLIFGMGFYQLISWFLRARDGSLLFFAIIAGLYLLRMLAKQSFFQELLGPSILAYAVDRKLAYATLILLTPAFIAFAVALFPRESRSAINRLFYVACALIALYIIACPLLNASILLPLFVIFCVAGLTYATAVSVLALVRRRPQARLIFMGLSFVLLTTVVDLFLTFQQHVPLNFVAHYGFVMFLFIDTLAIMRRWFRNARDVAHLSRNLQREVDAKTDELSRGNSRLEAAGRERTTLFQNISHEFRTPLTLIRGLLEVAIRSGRRIEAGEQKQILENAVRIGTLVDQLLELQSFTAGSNRLSLQKIDSAAFLRRITLSFEPYAASRQVRLDTTIDSDLPDMEGDSEKLERCLFNYLSNAFKFTPAGGTITVLARRTARDRIYLGVQDSGPGVPGNLRRELFQRFGYSAPDLHEGRRGSGLGLALVKEIVHMHGGRVGLDSGSGTGALFWMELPRRVSGEIRAETSAPVGSERASMSRNRPPNGVVGDSWMRIGPPGKDVALADLPAVETKRVANQGRGRCVLIVEDHEELRNTLEAFYREAGYRAESVGDGIEALQSLKSGKHVANLVVSDIMLPGMSGLDLTRNLRADPRFRHLPVVALTAGPVEEVKQEAHAAGVQAYLAKPVETSVLLSVSYNLVELREQEHRIAAELELAREIQGGLLPASTPKLPGIELTTRYRPMEAVGGDLYDFLDLASGETGIFLGDVSGHGFPAAMLASSTKMVLGEIARVVSEPPEILAALNSTIIGRTSWNYVSSFCGVVRGEGSERRLEYAMGGLPHIVLLRSGRISLHLSEGIPPGAFPNTTYDPGRLDLLPGDRVLFYTDGITEAHNPKEEMFGNERLAKALIAYRELSPDGFLDRLLEQVEAWCESSHMEDDITMILMDVH